MKTYIKRMLIVLPLCFCAGAAIMSLLPKYYTSSFVITQEKEQTMEVNRVFALNKPSEYDLGIVPTEHAFTIEGYGTLLKSDAFLYALLGQEYSTLNGDWQGTLGAYLNRSSKKPLAIEYDNVHGWYSEQAVATIKALRKSIESKVDYETDFMTISCTANDPLVATQLARNVNKALLEAVDQYEHQKMASILAQLKERAQEAELAYEQAKQQGNPNQETLGEIARSLSRQRVVYEAQMIHQPAYTTLQEPTVQYRKAGPSCWKLPLILTLLIGIGMVGWEKRAEITQYF